jgi:two-component system LytT family sensor kinase
MLSAVGCNFALARPRVLQTPHVDSDSLTMPSWAVTLPRPAIREKPAPYTGSMNSRRTLWLFAASFWGLFGLVSGFQVWISMITHGHSVPRLLGYHFLVWEAWLPAAAGIVLLVRRFPVVPPQRVNVLVHLFAACIIGLLHSFYWLGLLIWLKPYDRMTAEPSQLRVAEILFARLPLEWICYCLVLGGGLAFDYYERYRERTLQAARLEKSLADARLHALELQIQPHFLFNTMNAITSLVRTGRNDEAVEMTAGLSELLRYTLDHAGGQQVALEEELAVLRRYLEIQRARFPDRMTFRIDVSPEALRAAVPTLLLQPLAENAVRHGLALSAQPGVVEIRAVRAGARLQLDVFNSGRLDPGAPPGIGLRNTRERLEHLYGDGWDFELRNAGGGVLATISIPWSEA